MSDEGKTSAGVDRSSPLPLWAQISDDLRRLIGGGAFSDRFPTEAELMRSYGVSRHTVREALRRLAAEGLVVAERGRGTFVAPRFEQPLGAMYSLFRSIESHGVVQRSEVRRLEVGSDARAARRLGLRSTTKLVILERRRFAADEPLAVDTAWIPASLGNPLLAADFTHTALYDELARRCGTHLDSGEESITPVVPGAEQRRLLGIRARTGAFFLERIGRAQGTAVEYRETLIRGDRYRFVAGWSSTENYELTLVPTAAE